MKSLLLIALLGALFVTHGACKSSAHHHQLHASSEDTTHDASSLSTTSSSTSESTESTPFSDVFVGVILMVTSAAMIWYNERRTVKTQARLDKSEKLCTTIAANEPRPDMSGKLVHVADFTKTQDVIVDPVLQESTTGSVSMKRICEMFQWVEHAVQETDGSGNKRTRYEHKLEWVDRYVDSSSFHSQGNGQYVNDRRFFLLEAQTFYAEKVNLGSAFFLSQKQKELYQNPTKHILSAHAVDSARASSGIQHVHSTILAQQGYVYFKKNQGTGDEAGDFRISYKECRCGPTTIVAEVQGNTFETWQLNKEMEISSIDEGRDEERIKASGMCGICSCICQCCKELNRPLEEINWVLTKKVDAKQVFKEQREDDQLKTSVERALGFIFMIVGWYLLFSPIYSLLGWFPLIGGLLGSLGKLIAGIAALILGSSIAAIIMGIAWLRYRPVIALILILICGGIITYVAVSYGESGSQASTVTPAASTGSKFLLM